MKDIVRLAVLYRIAVTVGVCTFLYACSIPDSDLARGLRDGSESPHAPSPFGWPQSLTNGTQQPGFMSPEVKKGAAPLVYIASTNDNAIQIYAQAGHHQSPIGSITDGISAPFGLYVTKNGDLYVVNNGANSVTVYHQGQTSPYETLGTVDGPPLDVAVDAKGTVYVTTFDYEIEVYTKGATEPTGYLEDPTFTPYWDTVDSKGDAFVDDFAGAVYEFVGGSGTAIQLSGIRITYEFPGGLTMDQRDTLYVCDQGNGSRGTISAYKKPWTKGPAFSFRYSGDVTDCMIARNGKSVWGANLYESAGEEFMLPSGSVLDRITKGVSGPYGVALWPPS